MRMRPRSRVVTAAMVVAWILQSVMPATAEELALGRFSALKPSDQLPAEWAPLAFDNIQQHTRYALMADGAATVVSAHSRAGASGLIRRMRIDPRQFPWIEWRWKIERTLSKGDETRKDGDDYAARLYVAFALDTEKASWTEKLRHKTAGLFSSQPLPGSVLTYIWANKIDQGAIVSSPYTSQVKMIAVQSGETSAREWVSHRRNLIQDYQAAFGRPPPGIIGVAIMTDTDNTREETSAWYGDITLYTD